MVQAFLVLERGRWGEKRSIFHPPNSYLFHNYRGFIMYKYPLAFNMALMRFVHFSLIFLIRQSVNYTDHGSLISLHASNPLIQV